jgi:hypothetical protein
MRPMREAHRIGGGVVPGALVFNGSGWGKRAGSASISARSGAATPPASAIAARAES